MASVRAAYWVLSQLPLCYPHMRYSQSRLSPTAKPGLFNQGCICWLRFATQQCTLYRRPTIHFSVRGSMLGLHAKVTSIARDQK
jgi:hypothetical protein